MSSFSIGMEAIKNIGKVSALATTQKPQGTSMIAESGSPFKLEEGKIYGFGGAKVQIAGDKMQVVYLSKEYSGAVHEYDGGDWNGKPIDLSKYSKLIIVVQKVTGSMSNVKVELNDSVVVDFGQLKEGKNVVDLSEMKKDDFKPLTAIKKINFVNKPGQGKYRIQLYIK